MKAKRAAIFTCVAFACVLLLGAGATYGAGQYLSRPVRHSAGLPPPELFATPVLMPSRGGLVAGWVARGEGSGAVLLLHGLRADRRQVQERALFLNRLGYTVMLVDLPSHGESTGKRITYGVAEAEAVRTALAYLSRNLPGEKIGVLGVSLGAAATVLSRPGNDIGALVVEAMYATIGQAEGRLLAPLMTLRAGFNPAESQPVDALASLACPVLVMGGALDGHTTAAATQRLFDAAPQPKQLWLVAGAAHVDLHAFARHEYEKRVGVFFENSLRAAPKP